MVINKKEVNWFLLVCIFFHYEGDFIKYLSIGRYLQYDTCLCFIIRKLLLV